MNVDENCLAVVYKRYLKCPKQTSGDYQKKNIKFLNINNTLDIIQVIT